MAADADSLLPSKRIGVNVMPLTGAFRAVVARGLPAGRTVTPACRRSLLAVSGCYPEVGRDFAETHPTRVQLSGALDSTGRSVWASEGSGPSSRSPGYLSRPAPGTRARRRSDEGTRISSSEV